MRTYQLPASGQSTTCDIASLDAARAALAVVGPGWATYVLWSERPAPYPPLYVGMTNHVGNRLRQHQRDTRWAELGDTLHHIEFVRVGSKAEALTLEAVLIERLNPVWNVLTGGHRPVVRECR
jgi:predicted GIY-YIG superfamily endonuclease